MTIGTIAIVGSGYMGGGIAQTLALTGRRVLLADVTVEAARSARERLVRQAVAFEEAELFDSGAAALIAENLAAAGSPEEAVEAADYVAEAVPEDLRTKVATLARIDAVLPAHAFVGTNTSAIPIATLADAVADPARLLGVHWMNPAPFIPCVELIPTPRTDPGLVDEVEELLRAAGKQPVRVADTPGFVANRLQFALYRESALLVEEGVATAATVDAVVRNSFGFRLALFGPFAIGDMAGLDVYAGAYRTLGEAYGDRFSSPRLLEEAVAAGRLGTKSGRGILGIDAEKVPELLSFRDAAYARLDALLKELGPAPAL